MSDKPIRLWLVVVTVAGILSSVFAAAVLWLLLTQPVRASELFGGAL